MGVKIEDNQHNIIILWKPHDEIYLQFGQVPINWSIAGQNLDQF